jgi:segregation and condensation protein B
VNSAPNPGFPPPDECEPATDEPAEEGIRASDAEAGAPGALTAAQLEALLFVAERPLARREIAALAGVDRDAVDGLIGDLEIELGDRGIRLLAVGEHVALATAPEAGSLIARWVGAEGVRLSQASLEALAIIAYRQPATRAVVERIRGVDSDYVIRSLVQRRLVVELGRADTPGRPILYGTGFEFLERFGLASLEDLPVLEAEVAERLGSASAGEGSADGLGSGEDMTTGDETTGDPASASATG